MKERKRPIRIEGVPVLWNDKPLVLKGEVWYTAVPEDDDDYRVWEWSETTGRIVKPVGE